MVNEVESDNNYFIKSNRYRYNSYVVSISLTCSTFRNRSHTCVVQYTCHVTTMTDHVTTLIEVMKSLQAFQFPFSIAWAAATTCSRMLSGGPEKIDKYVNHMTPVFLHNHTHL